MLGHQRGAELAYIRIFHTVHYNAFQMSHKKPEKEMEKPMCFDCDEEKTFFSIDEIDTRDRMDGNKCVFKSLRATDCDKANTEMKATEEGEIHVANKAFYPK